MKENRSEKIEVNSASIKKICTEISKMVSTSKHVLKGDEVFASLFFLLRRKNVVRSLK